VKKEIIKENLVKLTNSNSKIIHKIIPKSVSEINDIIRKLLENNPEITNITVEGEISNFSSNKSGHYYFTIKDESSILSCAIFKYAVSKMTFTPRTGDKVIVKGSIKTYQPRGTYQLIADEIKKEGEGELYAKFIAIKEKLQSQGFFDPQFKKAIPKYPKIIGVVTSPTGSVIQDIINTVKRRFPKIKLIISPAKVQGIGSEDSIVNALQKIQEFSPDTIIIARGGGSMEDLWCFNEEKVAKEINLCKIPIISAVGHETDFTICDFTADLRAPTPTAAAELATPNLIDLYEKIESMNKKISKSLSLNIELKRINLSQLESGLENTFTNIIKNNKIKLENYKEKLEILSAKKTLERGYSITMFKGKRINNSNEVTSGKEITTILKDSKIISIVK
jgi:exodeoxyribonuclease VII large subunit